MDSDGQTTAKYQLNAAAALLSAKGSPSLAALYATRARETSLHPYALPLSPLHCPRCAHLPVSTRLLGNLRLRRRNPISKRRRTSKTMKTSDNFDDNNPQSFQTRKSSPSSSRGGRVRAMKSCAKCGYVGAEAFDELVEPQTTTADSAIGSFSSSIPMPSPASNKETETRTKAQQGEDNNNSSNSNNNNVRSSAAKPKGKTSAEASVQGTVVNNRPTASAQLPRSGSTASTGVVVTQSASATKRQKKKKAGLQEMLARSKEQEQKQKDAKQEETGLAAFLSEL